MKNLGKQALDHEDQTNEEMQCELKAVGFIESFTFQKKYFRNITETLHEAYKSKGNVFSTKLLGLTFIQLLGPEWNKLVYQNRDGVFSSEQGWELILKRIFPGSIMAMDGKDHLYQRRIMSQAFKKPKLVSYLAYMNTHIAEGIAQWQEDDGFMVFPSVKTLTLDLATRVFMGVTPNETSKKINQAFMDTVEASIAVVRLPIPPLNMWKGVKGRKYLVKQFYKLLPEKKSQDTPDFFSQFCHAESEDGEKFTDKELVDHMIFLMMAAHDTTTSTLTTLFYTLAKHPEWQERLRKKSQSLNKAHLEFDDLAELVEIEWAMKECLRMYPPLPTMPRRVLEDKEYNGIAFKKGNFVSIAPAHTHYMEECWDEPYTFDPERWSSERAEYKRHAYQWIPFGGGAHMCVGQHFADLQVKAVLHQILLQYQWSVPEDYEIPYQLMPIAKPKDGLPIKLIRL